MNQVAISGVIVLALLSSACSDSGGDDVPVTEIVALGGTAPAEQPASTPPISTPPDDGTPAGAPGDAPAEAPDSDSPVDEPVPAPVPAPEEPVEPEAPVSPLEPVPAPAPTPDTPNTPEEPATPAAPDAPLELPESPADPDSPEGLTPEPPASPESPTTPEAPETPPTSETPESPTQPTGEISLDRLVGRVRFEFGVTGASEVFVLEPLFSAGDITVDDTGDVLNLVQDGSSYTCDTLEGDNGDFGNYACVFIPVTARSELTANTIVLVVFDLGAAGQGSGAMEICTTEPVSDDDGEALGAACVVRLFLEPDGFVNVTVNGASSALAARSMPPGFELIERDHAAYLANAQQAQGFNLPVIEGEGSATVLSDAEMMAASALNRLVRSALRQ